MKLQLINKPRNTNVRILHDCTRFVHRRSMEQPRKRYQYDRKIMEFEFLWATIPVLSRMIVLASEYFCIDFVVCHRLGDAEMSSWICSLRISGLSELRSWQPELCELKCKLPYLLRVPINDNPCLTCVDLAVLLIELSDKPNRNGSTTFKIIQASCPWIFEWLLLKSLHNHKL